MSDLIDNFISSKTEIKGKWYVAKPMFYVGIYGIYFNIKQAFEVLLGKAIAVHFKIDEIENKK